MPLPADLHTRTVTASFPAATGTALPSSVTFTPTEALTDPTGAVIIPASPVTAPAPFGTASIVLACTDNATISQNGYWAYTVQVMNNGVSATPYNVLVPTGTGSIDLSALTPVTLTNPVQGSGITSVNGQTGPSVTITAAGLGALQAADNLSDLTNITTARTNLGLGAAATENVGTSAGTVAAGNDSRIVGAAQASALGAAAYDNVGTGAGTVAAGNDTRITGALQGSNNLSDLSNTATARTNLGLGGAATENVGTTSGTVAAGNDSRIVGAAQTSALGTAAFDNVGTGAGTVAAGNDTRITGALQAANNLSDVANAGTARTNLGLGAQAQQNTVGISSGVLAQVLPPRDCTQSGGSALTAGFLLLNCIQPGAILATNLGIWLTLAGVTSSGVNALALYDQSGNLIDQTADMSTQFAAGGYQEAALGSTHQLSANTNYYLAVLSHFSGTVPKAAAELAGANIPAMHGFYASLSKSSTASFPASVTLASLSLSTASYYLTIS